MTEAQKYNVVALFLAFMSGYLCCEWYNWKLFVILILFGWALNLENHARNLHV